MKKFTFLTVALLCAITTLAQPTPVDVEPGAMGALPAVPTISTTTPDHQFNALELSQVFMSSVIFNGSFSYEVWMSFPRAETMGGEYYTLEYHAGTDPAAEWLTYTNSDNETVQFKYDNAIIFIYSSYAQYRLRMHGGDMDGWVSNIVTAKHPVGPYPTSRGGWSISGQEMFTLVGSTQMKNFTFAVTAYDKSTSSKVGTYTQDSEYMRYQWYRRDPNTWDMTPIPGATMLQYAPVIADVGYQLVLEISGDNEHCSFTFMYPLNVVQLPVYGSASYYGNDGFVLNTNYVLPDPAKQLVQRDYDGEDQPLPATIVTKKPGQYAVYCDPDTYQSWYEVDIAGDEYRLIFQYLVDWGEEPELWNREAQLMAGRYYAPMTIKAVNNGKPVAATIDILGRNIDDELVVKATATLDATAEGVTIDREAGLSTLGEGYILLARPADAALAATYYPSALSIANAQFVKPGQSYDEEANEWVTASYTIEVQKGGSAPKEGDVNGDTVVDVADIASVISAMASSSLSDADKKVYDVNGDGVVDVADIATIISIMVKN